MEASMKDHKGPVNCIVVKNGSDDECVSASSDGSCIIWDMVHGRRRQSLFANTFFLGAVFHPDDSQLVTAGTDRKVQRAWRRAPCCRRRFMCACCRALCAGSDGRALGSRSLCRCTALHVLLLRCPPSHRSRTGTRTTARRSA